MARTAATSKATTLKGGSAAGARTSRTSTRKKPKKESLPIQSNAFNQPNADVVLLTPRTRTPSGWLAPATTFKLKRFYLQYCSDVFREMFEHGDESIGDTLDGLSLITLGDDCKSFKVILEWMVTGSTRPDANDVETWYVEALLNGMEKYQAEEVLQKPIYDFIKAAAKINPPRLFGPVMVCGSSHRELLCDILLLFQDTFKTTRNNHTGYYTGAGHLYHISEIPEVYFKQVPYGVLKEMLYFERLVESTNTSTGWKDYVESVKEHWGEWDASSDTEPEDSDSSDIEEVDL